MGKRKTRRITVDGSAYVWSRSHSHSPSHEHQPCVETLTVYLEGRKQGPLRLLFAADTAIERAGSTEAAHWEVGYPEDGVLWKTGGSGERVNLNMPGVVARIIRYAWDHGWTPKDAPRPLEIRDGFEWLEEIEWPASE